MKTIVIVGASKGIGKALVHYFAKDTSNQILALARNKKGLEVFSSYSNVQTFSFDLVSSNCREEAKSIFNSLTKIDILINNAGKLIKKPFLELTTEDLESSYQVNVIGVMETVQSAVPKMVENGGHIVNISSMGGFQGTVKFPGLSAYSTSKAAVVSFTELFSEEFKDTKIKMNCLCLGAVQTEMLAEAFPGYEAPLNAEEMAEFIGNFALTAHRYFNGKILPVSLSTP
jgi:3-oxoacyl-[acyl-carrier protein] reductase